MLEHIKTTYSTIELTKNVRDDVDGEGLHQVLVCVLDEVDGVEQRAELLPPGDEDGAAAEVEAARREHEARAPVALAGQRVLQPLVPPPQL